MSRALPSLVRARLTDGAAGVTSVCTAHPLVIEATLRHGLATGRRVLIEATCNQVNQEGGYTGMTPADFRLFVERIATRVGYDPARIILGGDHLGPNPWKHLAPAEAMERAGVMIGAYAEAGFSKLHLDTSMGCAGEPVALADVLTAERAATLAAVAEQRAGAGMRPLYVIGTEVPVPGGAQHALDALAVTTPEAARNTVDVHRDAFATRGLQAAFERAIGVVVQPGVEFGSTDVIPYRPAKAAALSAALRAMPGFVFEAHSTDYQPDEALQALVRDGFAILKVGPWLTFALREALYGLDAIARIVAPRDDEAGASLGTGLPGAMEALMLREPGNWQNYYEGDATRLKIQRHFSYSDRIRYYWPHGEAQRAVDRLFERLGDQVLPSPLVSQYLGHLFPAVSLGEVRAKPRELALAAVTLVLDRYERACMPASAARSLLAE